MANYKGGNNQGYQHTTMAKCLVFVYCYLFSKHISPNCKTINFGGRNNGMTQLFKLKYQSCIDNLLKLGIIKITKDAKKPKIKDGKIQNQGQARTYSIDKNMYITVLSNCLTKEKDFILDKLKEKDKTNCLKLLFKECDLDNIETNSELCNAITNFFKKTIVKRNPFEDNTYYINTLINSLSKDFYEGLDKKLLETIDNADFFALTPIQLITDREFTRNELERYKQIYAGKIMQHPLGKLYYEEVQNAHVNKLNTRSEWKIKHQKYKTCYNFIPSCRQSTSLSQTTKEERKPILKKDGFDGEYDIHSTVFTIAKAFNTGKIDLNWDIKKELISKGFKDCKGKKLTKDNYKTIGMRAFFKCSNNEAYGRYWNAINDYFQYIDNKNTNRNYDKEYFNKKYKNFPILKKDVFLEICEECDKLTGDITKYYYNIFPLESIIELHTMNEITKKGFSIANVYDCFYFKKKEISEEQIIKEIEKSFSYVYRYLYKYL